MSKIWQKTNAKVFYTTHNFYEVIRKKVKCVLFGLGRIPNNNCFKQMLKNDTTGAARLLYNTSHNLLSKLIPLLIFLQKYLIRWCPYNSSNEITDGFWQLYTLLLILPFSPHISSVLNRLKRERTSEKYNRLFRSQFSLSRRPRRFETRIKCMRNIKVLILQPSIFFISKNFSPPPVCVYTRRHTS